MATEAPQYAQFLDQPDKLPQDVQFDAASHFVADYNEQLAKYATEAGYGDKWELSDDVIGIDLQPTATESLANIMGSSARENKCFFKLVLSFSTIAMELAALNLEAHNKVILPLLNFGEQPDGKDMEDGDVQLCFGRILPVLLHTWTLCDRIYTVVQHLIRQLASLYSQKYKKKSPLTAYQAVHFQPIWSALAEALGTLITIDEVIRQNEAFVRCATVFKRMMRTVKSTPSKYSTDLGTTKRFEYLMQCLEGDIMDDMVYQNCLVKEFEHKGTDISIHGNSIFQAEFFKAIQAQFNFVSKALAQSYETDKRYQFVGFCGLYVMYLTLFPEKAKKDSEHKKFLRQVWDVQRKVPLIHLGGHVIFCPCEWLSRKASDFVNIVVKDAAKEIHAAQHELLSSMEACFESQVSRLYGELVTWASRLNSKCGPDYDGDASVVKATTTLLVQGVQYAWDISHLFRTFLLLHMQLDRPLSVSKVFFLCKCMEMLKAIQATLHRKVASISNLLTLLCDQLNADVVRLLLPLRRRLHDNEKKLDDSQIDQLSALEVIISALHGAPTRAQLMVIRLAMSVAIQKTSGLVQEADFDEARQLLRKLDLVANHQPSLKDACDCSILYWFRSMLPTYLKTLVRRPDLVNSLHLITIALHDPAPVLLQAKHLADPQALLQAYAAEVREHFMSEVLTPVQKEIEDDLRLHIHAVILGQDSRDLKQLPTLRDLSRITTHPPLRLFGSILDFRKQIEHYLDRQFYNLSAISQHDWKTYEELRVLAKEKYDLGLMEVYLPGSNLEQGLDVLEITRNIRLFVARYSYNLNNQLFIEKPTLTNAQNLHTIHIRHVANSIRTHGTGFMDSTVNFVYQFLGKKLFVFSQFLYDDHIKSRLMRDHRGFLETKEECGGRYPVKKAERFVKYVKKLPGQTADASFLELFRGLVTEIGNALGYVRMVRSGGMRFVSEAAKFVPDLTVDSHFGSMAADAGLRPCTVEAAEQLDQVLSTLRSKLAEGSDYFQMLEHAFAAEMNKEQNQHLRNFFVIVPSLTLLFVDNMLAAKDRANQKGKEAAFTDDGFALGVAFLLKLLGQNSDFDSLHWFTSIEEHYQAHLQELAVDQKKSKHDTTEVPTLRLTRAKVEAAMHEFELLFYAFKSSRVFFSESVEENEEEAEGQEEDDEGDAG